MKWLIMTAIAAAAAVRIFLIVDLPFTVDELKLAESLQTVSWTNIPAHYYGFGWGENVALSYFALPFVKIFPMLSPVYIFRAVVFAANGLFVLFIFRFLCLLFGNKTAMVGVLFALSSAWSIRASVIGYNAFLLPGAYVAALYFLFRGIQSRRPRDYLLAALILAIPFYSYAASFVVVPLLGAVMLFVCRKTVIWRQVFLSAVLTTTLVLPMILFYLKNQFDLPLGDHFLFFSFPTLAYTRFDQGSIFLFSSGLSALFEYLSNYFKHAFLIGSAYSIDGISLLYLGLVTDALFIPFGVYALFKRRKSIQGRLMLIYFIAFPLASSFVSGDLFGWSYTRDTASLPIHIALSAVGALFIAEKLFKPERPSALNSGPTV